MALALNIVIVSPSNDGNVRKGNLSRFDELTVTNSGKIL